jgi:hypothetical protein
MAILLLLGYAALAPFCFLAGSFSFSPTHTTSPSAHCLMGMGCEGGIDNTSPSPIDTVAEHLGMYLSLTGELLNAFSLLSAFVLYTIAVGFATIIIKLNAAILKTETLRSIRRNIERRAVASRVFLRWLKRNTISPPVHSFAY